MSLMDKMMDSNMENLKEMQKKMLDFQEELYTENGDQIERVNKMRAEREAAGTRVHYEAVAEGVKEGLKETKFCEECGAKISRDAKYCSECGKKQ